MAKDILYPLRRLHGKLHDKNQKRKLCRAYLKHFRENPKSLFLLMTPEHGNLGDHAIAKAETMFLSACSISYIEVSSSKLKEMKWANQLDVFNGFPILINGGGNLGTLWMDVEDLQREIVINNPLSKIYFLPNTIFYEKDGDGQEELRKSMQIYNQHRCLTFYAREKTSFDFMKPIFRDVRLVPDMVLSMKPAETGKERRGCVLCLRSDPERIRTQEQDDMIRQQAESLFGEQVMESDMVIPGSISVDQREATLNEKFEQFASAQLVITDRLHGMIFCAITGTPCIVIDSKSPKVRGCYEWIRHLGYIRFAEKVEDIAAEYRAIPDGPHHYDNSHLIHYYESLAEDIQNIWR